jgi:hypothetical protein
MRRRTNLGGEVTDNTPVVVELLDGSIREVTIENLREALPTLPSSEGVLRAYFIDGQKIELLTLLESVLRVGSGKISSGEAIRVSRRLGLQHVPQPRNVASPSAPYPLRSALARLAGQWVAIADDTVIASAETLKVLLEKTDGTPASITFVPVRDERS